MATFTPIPMGGGGTGADVADAFVTIGHPADLTGERALTGSATVDVADGGANNAATLSLNTAGAAAALAASFDASGAATAAVAAHVAAGDPHPVYLTAAEGNAAYDATGAATAAVATHVAAGDPHPVYLTAAEGNAAYDAIGAAAAKVASVTGTAPIASSGGLNPAISLNDDGVTYAKMQNVSAASRVLGRGSAAGAGDPEELTLGGGLSMVGTVLTQGASVAGDLLRVLTADSTMGANTSRVISGPYDMNGFSLTIGDGASLSVL